jgi:hypothetical protein
VIAARSMRQCTETSLRLAARPGDASRSGWFAGGLGGFEVVSQTETTRPKTASRLAKVPPGWFGWFLFRLRRWERRREKDAIT